VLIIGLFNASIAAEKYLTDWALWTRHASASFVMFVRNECAANIRKRGLRDWVLLQRHCSDKRRLAFTCFSSDKRRLAFTCFTTRWRCLNHARCCVRALLILWRTVFIGQHRIANCAPETAGIVCISAVLMVSRVIRNALLESACRCLAVCNFVSAAPGWG